MARVYQVPQHAFIWLMTGAVMASLPHFLTGPAWLPLFVITTQVWRILVQRGRLRMPAKITRAVVLVGAVAGTLYTYGTLLGPEAGIVLLVCTFNLKLLEMFKLRDAYVAIVLCYFVIATALLSRQDLLISLYVFAVLGVITAALIGINQPEANIRARQQLKYSLVLVLQAMPLMIFLFFVVPRVPPLWDLPIQKKGAKTGMSNSMAPGEVSSLSRSAALAFRVDFKGEPPPPEERYWRGLTYSWFDGTRWSQAVPNDLPQAEYMAYPGERNRDWYREVQRQQVGKKYNYQIILEPTRRRWLFALVTPFTEQRGIAFARDSRLINADAVRDVLAYRVESFTEMPRGENIPDWEKVFNLRLPEEGNGRTRSLAQRWRTEAGSDEAFIRKALSWFREEEFYYSLEPPLLTGQQIDDFLFRTRTGFCEHYASSFAFMLRSVGIPARIVAGYQGGELNPLGTHLLVRQYDAHAWVEAWLPGKGWQEFDPTAMVAPERVRLGLAAALEAQNDESFATFNDLVGISGLPLLKDFMSALDYAEFQWLKLVVDYDTDAQKGVLQKLLGDVSPMRIALLIGAGLGVVAAAMGLLLFWQSRSVPLNWWEKEYWALYKGLQKKGIPVSDDLGPLALARLATAHSATSQPAAKAWLRLYNDAAYRTAYQDKTTSGVALSSEDRRNRLKLRKFRKEMLRLI